MGDDIIFITLETEDDRYIFYFYTLFIHCLKGFTNAKKRYTTFDENLKLGIAKNSLLPVFVRFLIYFTANKFHYQYLLNVLTVVSCMLKYFNLFT